MHRHFLIVLKALKTGSDLLQHYENQRDTKNSLECIALYDNLFLA